jgi:L-alanine-DL-glutamate epimerase-like enolase superfamily enzyme
MSVAEIRTVDCLPLRLPFDHGGGPPMFAGKLRTTLDSGLIRVELAGGVVGWGEAYATELDALASVVRHRVAPLAVGRLATDEGLVVSLDRVLHNLGRAGVVQHALSGLDIALWDARAKLERVPLCELIGGARRHRIPAYASLLQYRGEEALIRRFVEQAVSEGFGAVKLHEREPAAVAAAREALGPGMPLMVDTNCAWSSLEDAVPQVTTMARAGITWIEEPLWPPEDAEALIALRRATGVPTAVGENATSLHHLMQLVHNCGVDYVQPSAIKVGGVSALLALSRRCEDSPVHFSPQAAFFGPGFLATLHVLAAHQHPVLVERLWCGLLRTPYAATIPVRSGGFELNDLPGLGADPDAWMLDATS